MHADARKQVRGSGPLIIVLVAVLLVWSATVNGEKAALASPGLVKQLVTALTANKLNAIATKDPESPDRYVAGMLFPGVQLLVISAAANSRPFVDAEMADRRYDSVYSDLHHGPAVSKLFIQDMGADGIHALDGGVADVVWERGVTQHLLNGDHKAANKSESEYAKLVQNLDARYARVLKLLLAAAQAQVIFSPGEPPIIPR